MSRAHRWRVRGGKPKEEKKEGWVLVGQGHPASNRRGLSSGSSLLAEKNGSKGGWILYFWAGREVKAIRKDCPPGKEDEKKALSSISTSFSRGLYLTHSPICHTAQVSVRLCMRTFFPSAHSPFTRFLKQMRKGGQQAYHASRLRRFRQTVFASSAILSAAVWAGCPSLLLSIRLWITGTNVVEWNSRRVTHSTVPRFEVQVVMITPGYAPVPLRGT
nr:hypothetical protein [Tanacetum cinerariifolium]